jgi:hypothetical protein
MAEKNEQQKLPVYTACSPTQQAFTSGVQMQQQPHVNPMVQNPDLQLGYPSGYMVPNTGMAYHMPVHANTYPVVNPSHSQDNRQQAFHHHHGINAHKIGEYANATVRVGGAAIKLFHTWGVGHCKAWQGTSPTQKTSAVCSIVYDSTIIFKKK